MTSANKLKEWMNPFLKRSFPRLFKNILLFSKIYQIFFRGSKDKEWDSFHIQTRVGTKHLYNVYAHPDRTIWTTMFVPSEICFPKTNFRSPPLPYAIIIQRQEKYANQ